MSRSKLVRGRSSKMASYRTVSTVLADMAVTRSTDEFSQSSAIVKNFDAGDVAQRIWTAVSAGSTVTINPLGKGPSTNWETTAAAWRKSKMVITVRGDAAVGTTMLEGVDSEGNYLGTFDKELVDFETGYYGGGNNYKRLQAAKQQVDSRHRMRRSKGVVPSSGFLCEICWRSRGYHHGRRKGKRFNYGKFVQTRRVSCPLVAERKIRNKDEDGKCGKNNPYYIGAGAAGGLAVVGAGGVLISRKRKKDTLKNRLTAMAESGDKTEKRAGSVSLEATTTTEAKTDV